MFQRICQYSLVDVNGQWYRPRAYGDPRPGGTWDGWLVFFPVRGGPAIASDRETTQASLQALTTWAVGLTPVYIEGALIRALELAHEPDVIAQLAAAEYEALADAEQLESAAEVERMTATADEMAAAEARAEAERLHQERLATERALATTEEIATNAAEKHKAAAPQTRTVATTNAVRRTGEAQSDTTPPKKHRSKRKK